MEQLCLCSVMLNQFLLNSKLKLGFHSSDISDVYSEEKDHEAPKRLSTGGPAPQSAAPLWTSLTNSCKSGWVLVGMQGSEERSSSFGLPQVPSACGYL